ncbi:CarD family transcriptional regulator [Kurthia huakuii]|uniref:CarD family transcriptional regulator n=1 Tax=Kurthia huakuii TaxID=1421019 RepID=UPI000497FCD0|nr:CarD family transcriptional regulator [Kurthia huakuii]
MEANYLFQIGENIIYPMYGAGIIKAIEQKEIKGQPQACYVIHLTASNMQLTVPETKFLSSNIRSVTDITELQHIIDIFQHGESDSSLPWKQRYTVNTDKVKTGKIQECAEVVRDLMRLKEDKALNTSEKAMLNNTHKFLLSELNLIKGITETEINIFS